MILGFTAINHKTKQPTGFELKILHGEKIHSLRKGNRWKAGMSIQMATGVRTKAYNQFNKLRPDLQVCTGTQDIKIRVKKIDKTARSIEVWVDNRKLNVAEVIELAQNDGFNSVADFYNWFMNAKELPNQIVHWTNFRY